MKICDSWLRNWVEHGLAPDELAHRLTMLGLEVESVAPVGAAVERLVVGRVTEVRRHPNADRLSLCQVDVGSGEPLGIVCGAPNVRAGGLYATALEGARLPGGLLIRSATIRGEPSAGMLCSATELGLEGATSGLLELDASAVPGSDASRLLELGDVVLDINVTPNRADCLGVAGIAREVGAGTGKPVHAGDAPPVPCAAPDQFPVSVADAVDCPRFAGRVIRGLRADARTPLWMQERLRRCGVRPIHPVVDSTNYVMLEMGQPMHAYDLATLSEGITVRRGVAGEQLVLLDGREVEPDENVVVIAHEAGPVGLAGIMGGSATAVTTATRDIFLESAFFAPAALAGRARRFGLHTEASVRFERGVDPSIQAAAVERATRLILEIAGGIPGPVTDVVATEHLPKRNAVRLRRARMARLLGATVPDAEVVSILDRLGILARTTDDGWSVTPPPARFDIEREEDVIEEIARVHGYEKFAPIVGRAAMHASGAGETADPLAAIIGELVARGYHEAITYSFVEPGLAARLGARDCPQLTLANPISAELAVMRQSLWPGLVRAARDNLHRQQDRVRLFEVGSRFLPGEAGEHREEDCVAGVIVGRRLPEQWGLVSTSVDFFDVKGDVEALLALAGRHGEVAFESATHPALHPGRSARLDRGGEVAGWIGELHPALARELDLPAAVLFELRADMLLGRRRPSFQPMSKFPSVRRDLAVIVPVAVAAADLLVTIRAAAPRTLRDAFVFDIYTGRQIGDTEKSVAIGLILQDTSRTLTDEDAEGILQAIRAALGREWQARIRQ